MIELENGISIYTAEIIDEMDVVCSEFTKAWLLELLRELEELRSLNETK